MSSTVLYMSMSFDGFDIAGPSEGPDNGLGDGGERLHDCLCSSSASSRWSVGARGRGWWCGSGARGRPALSRSAIRGGSGSAT